VADLVLSFVLAALLPAVVGAVGPIDPEVRAAADCHTTFVLVVRGTK
jgi:hypothetical protein